MNISLPAEIEHLLSEADVALHLAIGLFVDGRVTLGQGAAVAGIPTTVFLAELGKRRIPIHYDARDAMADIETVSKLGSR